MNADAINITYSDILSDLTPHTNVVVAHGCNCFHTMGSGIAAYLRRKYPEIFTVDCHTEYGSRDKLGSMSIAEIALDFHILNCYTQYKYGQKNGPHVDYEAIRKCFTFIADHYSTWEIRIPMIGCGLAGGDWGKVKAIISEVFDETHNLRIFDLPQNKPRG